MIENDCLPPYDVLHHTSSIQFVLGYSKRNISRVRTITTVHVDGYNIHCIIIMTIMNTIVQNPHLAIAGLQAKPAITVNTMHMCRVTTRMHKYRLLTIT